jgi:hypothetical protein
MNRKHQEKIIFPVLRGFTLNTMKQKITRLQGSQPPTCPKGIVGGQGQPATASQLPPSHTHI